MWSPDKELLKRCFEVLKRYNSSNKCNSIEALNMYHIGSDLELELESYLEKCKHE